MVRSRTLLFLVGCAASAAAAGESRAALHGHAREAFLRGDHAALVSICESIVAGLEQEADAAAGDARRLRGLAGDHLRRSLGCGRGDRGRDGCRRLG